MHAFGQVLTCSSFRPVRLRASDLHRANAELLTLAACLQRHVIGHCLPDQPSTSSMLPPFGSGDDQAAADASYSG